MRHQCAPPAAVGTSSAHRLALYLFVGLVGAALLTIPASYYRIDRVSCLNWPPPRVNAALTTVYLGAVALLALCWRGWWSARPGLWPTLAAGLLLHAVALLAPPFLSTDPLFYAATGRAMAKYHASPYAQLRSVLPADDPILRSLSPDWRAGTSAYFPGWNELARGVAWLAGDALSLQLRLYQALSLLVMVAAAGIVGLAVRVRDAQRAGSAAAAVIFCPLAVIEGTLSAHNDQLLALAVALLVLMTVKKRPLAGLMAVAMGLVVKASALLLAGFAAVAWCAGRFRLTTARLTFVGLAFLVAAFRFAPTLAAAAGHFTDLLNPSALQCERAIECIPRWLLWRRHHFTAAFAVGIAFRIAGALWLFSCAVRAGQQRRLLPWLATGIFVYYLYFHAYVQAWYLLPLLPLLPFSSARTRPAMAAACVAWVCHYAAELPLNCWASSTELWVERAVGIALVLLAPTALLLRSRQSGLLAGVPTAGAREIGD